jgi:hypothetical protein
MPIILSAPAKRKNTRKAALPPMRNNGASWRKSKDGGWRKGDLGVTFSYAAGGYYGSTPREDGPVLPTLEQAKAWAEAHAPAKRKNTRKTALPPMRNNSVTASAMSYYIVLDPRWANMGTGFFAPSLEAARDYAEKHFDTRSVRKAADPRKAPARRNGSRSTVDPVAARELELYIENEANLVGPGNSLGANIMRMLAGRIVRGTYDSTKAWKAWVPLTTEGAKRYKREIGSLNASKATRDAVATRLSEAFESEVRSGGINPLKLLGKR